MHGRKGSIRKRISELKSEIDREFRKPDRDEKKIKNLWWRIYQLENKGNISIG